MAANMTITEFANELITTLKTTFPEIFERATLAVQTVPKPGNVLLTGITVHFQGSNVAPCYYIDEPYNKCLKGMPVTAVASDLAEYIRKTNNLPAQIDVSSIQDFEAARAQIFPRLIDARHGKNCDYLANKVSRNIPGTGINVIYDVELSRDKHGETIMSTAVTNQLAELWNIPLEELHETAIQNAVRQRPLYFTDMNGILNSLAPDEFPEIEAESLLYVLTNNSKQYGAAAILYPETAKMLHDRFRNGFYVLPSSVHELIIVPKALSDDPDMLKAMVTSINAEQVLPAEQLSDSVYTLDADGNLAEVR